MASGKRLKIENEKIKTAQNNSYGQKITINLCEEIMNSKQKVMGNLVMWYKFAFAITVMLNVSFVKRCKTGTSVCMW